MGLSQSSFVNRFGLSVYALRNWEQGIRAYPFLFHFNL